MGEVTYPKRHMKEIGGIKDSTILTKKIKKKLEYCFDKIFKKKEALLLCWGSVARNEMGPKSDLDILLIMEGEVNHEKVDKFFKILSAAFKNRIDLLEAYDLKTLSKIASIDGTDREALLLAQPICGNKKIENIFANMQSIFYKQHRENIRELLHMWVNLFSVSKNLAAQQVNDIKSGRGLIRCVNFIFLITKIFFDEHSDIKTTPDAIRKIHQKGFIDKKTKGQYISYVNVLFAIRNGIHLDSKKEESNILNDFNLKSVSKKISLSPRDIDSILEKIKSNYSKFENRIINIILTLSQELKLPEKEITLISVLLNFGEEISGKIEIEIIKTKSEILLVLLAHRTNSPKILEFLRKNYPEKWYILYGIANNMNTNPDTLFKLVKPERGSNENLKQLYNGFAWRNIRLYVAKNQKADKRTLLYITNHLNSRPMDVVAAKKNLSEKAE